MGVEEKPDIIDTIEKKRLQWNGHVKRMPEQRLPKLIMEWIPRFTPFVFNIHYVFYFFFFFF